ncbi:MAG: class I SAM-dependent methyltransferase [Deltaproteobacteria bacterium]|nr:class I SAM-dependent methyltransferase [Deltaproteobacteria bacterium]
MTAVRSSIRPAIRKTLDEVARFYDRRKVGDVGSLGFRRSTDLARLTCCLDGMVEQGLLIPGHSRFLDLGCADGRVSVLLSYLVRLSVGIELDEWTLDEYGPLKQRLEDTLVQNGLPLPPQNLFLFHGDSTDEALHQTIREKTGVGFRHFDLFYTYLTMQEEFAELIVRKAHPGALFMVYGLESILPRFRGLRLLTPRKSMEGVLALYKKE